MSIEQIEAIGRAPLQALDAISRAVWTDHAAGFGPYYVRVWQHSRYLTLQRNPYYYGGRPALRQITLRFYQDQQVNRHQRQQINQH